MIRAARRAREARIPYFGICLGMQVAVIECGALRWRASRGPTPASSPRRREHCVIDLMPDQRGVVPKGGTMRLGAYPCAVAPGSLLDEAYGARGDPRTPPPPLRGQQRLPRAACSRPGVRLSGLSPDGRLVEAVELPGHPFFVGVQYHPEFKSRPNRAHPLFREFVAASLRAGRGAG